MHIQTKLFFTLFFVSLISLGLHAQNNYNQVGKALETKAIKLGTTSPIKDLVPLGPISKEKKKQWKKENKVPRNFVGRGANKVVHPDLEHQGKDKLRQGIAASTNKMTDALVLANFDGITNGSPNDPSGDIGKDHYMLAINATEIAVYDKGGNELATFAANTLWQEIGFSSAGDPIILYDQIDDRWIITEFPSGNQLLVAISENSDPLGSYDVYNFQTPNFPDYPKYAIWDDVITVTTNEQGANNLTTYFINKVQLYKGADEVQMQRLNLPGSQGTEQGFFVATPVNWIGQTAPKSKDPIFLNLDDSSWGDVDEDQVKISTVSVDWTDPDNTSFSSISVVLSPYDGYPCSDTGFGFQCVPQGGTGGGLDAIPEVIMNIPIYRNFNTHESLVFNFVTDVTDGDNLAGIRWVELRREDADWYLYQEGTYSPDDGLDRYMGAIAIDGSGNIGLAYNASSEDEFVSVRFTGRKWDDELGIMTIPEQIVVEGENTINSFGRFGDYAQMGVDPINDKTFWYVTEYAKGAGSSSSTRVLAFEIDRDTMDIGAFRYNGPTSSSFELGEEITITINNFGLEDVSNFTAGYIFENGTPVTESVTETIPAGESIEYTFTQTVDFIGSGEYSLVGFTAMEDDAVIANDTFKVSLNAIAANDAGILGVYTGSSQSCEDFTQLTIELQNFGSDTLKSADIEVFLNGNSFIIENWTGSLGYCQMEVITISITGLTGGENVVEVEVSNPNNNADSNLLNNNGETTFTFIEDAVTATLNFIFDQYPNETTWELLDENGMVLESGGPYPGENTASVEFCLDSTACYEFVLYDSFGDGIFSPGGYTITNSFGGVLASLISNNFGSQENNEFCAEFSCMLNVDIDVTPADDDGGTILLTPTNGIGPFMYSIDGGATFQDNGLFEGVDVGNYLIVVEGDFECLYNGQIDVEACNLDVVVEFEDVSGQTAGAINFIAQGGQGPYEYSIDGGTTWQNSSLFIDVPAGEYDLRVRDSQGCVFITDVTIDTTTNTSTTKLGNILIATPNPTSGLFNIHLEGDIQAGTFIEYEIFNAEGRLIRNATLVKYGQSYTSQVSISHEPAGSYYLRVNSANVRKLVKIIKI